MQLPVEGSTDDPPNPLLKAWLSLGPQRWPYGIGGYDFPDHGSLDRLVSNHKTREECNRKYSFAIPTEKALARIVALSPIVEIGAGTGYWAKLLTDRGADVIAYDARPTDRAENFWHKRNPAFHPVLHGGSKRAKRHPDRALFLCWPPYDTPMAIDALVAYKLAGGRRLVYIGEGGGGCTGNAAFHDELEENWNEVDAIALPQWFGIHDWLWVYERQ